MGLNKIFTIEIATDYGEKPADKKNATFGKITIPDVDEPDFYEYFYMSPSIWSIADYQRQWKLAWKYFQTHDTTVFVVNVQANPMVMLWVLYKIGEYVYIRNRLIIAEYYHEFIGNVQYTPETSFNFIPLRDTFFTEDGYPVSEWKVKIS